MPTTTPGDGAHEDWFRQPTLSCHDIPNIWRFRRLDRRSPALLQVVWRASERQARRRWTKDRANQGSKLTIHRELQQRHQGTCPVTNPVSPTSYGETITKEVTPAANQITRRIRPKEICASSPESDLGHLSATMRQPWRWFAQGGHTGLARAAVALTHEVPEDQIVGQRVQAPNHLTCSMARGRA